MVKRQNHATSLASIIPAFPDQTRCLIAQFRAAKQRFHSLLIEGDFGIGKGTSLEHWIEQEIKDRPCRYIRLSFLENPNIFETIEEDIEIDLRWREEIIQALGYTNDMDDFDDFDEIMHEITTSLIQLRPTLSKPPLLIIDDMNILFYKHQALTSKYGDLEITFEWLNNLQNKDLIDLVFCCSEKSVLGALTKFKGFQHLQYKNVDGVDDEAFLKYLVKENKFSESDALLFVYNFNGSLDELNKFVVLKRSSNLTLQGIDDLF